MGAPSVSDDQAKLREALSAGAKTWELEDFIRRNKGVLTASAEFVLRHLTPVEQRHVLRKGDLPADCNEAIICGRVKDGLNLERELTKIVNESARRQKAPAEEEPDTEMPMLFLPAAPIEATMSKCEVIASESRFAPPKAGAAIVEEPERPKEGTVVGVGGVIEVTKKKFGCDPGQRLHVIGEKGNLWQCEGGVGINKAQTGAFRWVLRADAAAAQGLRGAAAQAAAAEEAEAPQAQQAQQAAEEEPPAPGLIVGGNLDDERCRAIRVMLAREREAKIKRDALKLTKRQAAAKAAATIAETAEKEVQETRSSSASEGQAKDKEGRRRQKEKDSDGESSSNRKTEKKRRRKTASGSAGRHEKDDERRRKTRSEETEERTDRDRRADKGSRRGQADKRRRGG